MLYRYLLLGGLATVAAALLFSSRLAAQDTAPGAGERRPFHQVLVVPPNDQDYIVTRIPPGTRAVVTDVIAFNAADGKGKRVADGAESHLWVGGYVSGKSVGLVNRMRLLGNTTEQWHLETGFELSGAPELVVSSEKGVASESPVLVHISGYLTR